MEEATLIDKLMLFGLTRQEASIYLCLASNRELSGYEVSKITGISRSNVYNALASLVEEGAAYLIEGSTNKYTSVEVEEFCQNKIRYLQQTKDELVHTMPQIGTGFILCLPMYNPEFIYLCRYHILKSAGKILNT